MRLIFRQKNTLKTNLNKSILEIKDNEWELNQNPEDRFKEIFGDVSRLYAEKTYRCKEFHKKSRRQDSR